MILLFVAIIIPHYNTLVNLLRNTTNNKVFLFFLEIYKKMWYDMSANT